MAAGAEGRFAAEGRGGVAHRAAPVVVTTALAVRSLLFLGGMLTGVALLLAAVVGKKGDR